MRRALLLAFWLALLAPAYSAQPARSPTPAPPADRAQVEALLGRLGKVCLTAKSPADLDRIQAELDALKPSGALRPEAQLLMPRLEGGRFFLTHWREYLQARQARKNREAIAALDTILRDVTWIGLVPRANILARRQVRLDYPIFYPANCIEDLPGAIAAMNKVVAEAEIPITLSTPVQDYQEVLDLWNGRARQNWDEIVRVCEEPGKNRDVTHFKHLLLPYAIPGYLRLPKAYQIPPKKGEVAVDYLADLIEKAEAAGDLVSLWRLTTYFSHLADYHPAWDAATTRTLEACLKAQKLEAEGKPVEAVRSYLAALQGPYWAPVTKVAGARLAALKKENPAAYEEGLIPLRYLPRMGPPFRDGLDPFGFPNRPDSPPAPRPWTKY